MGGPGGGDYGNGDQAVSMEGGHVFIVCGGRDYADQPALFAALDALHEKRHIGLIVQGGCKSGADLFAKLWCLARGVHCAQVDALWDFFGPSAGPKRNRAMKLTSPDGVIAFPGGRGTADMVQAAEDAGIKVWKPKG